MRDGEWIQTVTGKAFYPLDPRKEEVCIEDIAHVEAIQNHVLKKYTNLFPPGSKVKTHVTIRATYPEKKFSSEVEITHERT